MVCAGAFGVRQTEMERQERTPRERGALGWVESDPSRALVAAGVGGQEVGVKRGGVCSRGIRQVEKAVSWGDGEEGAQGTRREG